MKTKSKQKTLDHQFRALRWRLLLSYLLVMMAIRLLSNILIYQLFAHGLYQQLDQRLINLAQSAAHSLIDIKNNPKAVDNPAYRKLDQDGDLDIAWQNLRQPQQSVEWFGDRQEPLAHSGNLQPAWPFKVGFQTVDDGKIRILTIMAYHDPQEKRHLEGYVRVSESTQSVEAVLNRLRWKSMFGGMIALGLIGVGGMWLTRQSLKPIEQSFRQLKQFTADASHELRSPLTAIKTSVTLLKSHPERFQSEDIPKLDIILSATDQMSHLVEDLLLLARMDGKREMSRQGWQKIPLIELLEDVVEFLEPNAEGKDITLQLFCFKDAIIKGESHQLLRLFSNLVENALQYTPIGGKVTVSLKQDDQSALVMVEDTGIGIAEENLPHIFDRLWREDTARSYRPQGSGLGLAISQAIAQHHDGEITVKSQVGMGSCFQVRLPLVS
ncbi:two-component sensor histidine kinase [Crocosphaera subtropica ATCC 51142]|uniref:histidine kinase n=1 Tax=Crocosphaera subtropica (strain ATCC 51142 / BH68) TaxID=43989 RepID=B1WSZ0_CROS5|nr:HAMP domain-containing sensor histidine kinase [Crocosphaera subtropica]ACB50320.1 two-component sensor histidine kinase [Crocosphaera subtropica ATCC 51142]